MALAFFRVCTQQQRLLNTFHPIYPGSFLAISGDDDELIPEARHDQLASVRKMPTRLHIFAAICTPE
jgi:hypothetical protein